MPKHAALHFNGKTVPATLRARRLATELSKAFNGAADDNRFSRQFAAHFSKHAGLRGIAGNYVFSEGATPDEVENGLVQIGWKPEGLPLLRRIWSHMKSLNPELKTIRLRKDNVEDVWNAIF